MAPRLLAWVIKRMPVIRQELFEERQVKAEIMNRVWDTVDSTL